MADFRRAAKKVLSLNKVMEMWKEIPANSAAEAETFQSFKSSIERYERDFSFLKDSHRHDLDSRLQSLIRMNDILVDFHKETEQYGQYFANEPLRRTYMNFFNDLKKFLAIIVDSQLLGEVEIGSYHPEYLGGIVAETVTRLLEAKYNLVKLVYEFLTWTTQTKTTVFDGVVLKSSKTTAKLIDRTIEVESLRLVGIGLEVMQHQAIEDTFASIAKHKNMNTKGLLNLMNLQGKLAMEIALKSIHEPSYPCIEFDSFQHINSTRV